METDSELTILGQPQVNEAGKGWPCLSGLCEVRNVRADQGDSSHAGHSLLEGRPTTSGPGGETRSFRSMFRARKVPGPIRVAWWRWCIVFAMESTEDYWISLSVSVGLCLKRSVVLSKS